MWHHLLISPLLQDYGLLWKHVEYRNGHNESRRSRRLVISSIATVVNYEYCFYWYLYQVGSRGGGLAGGSLRAKCL
jgi:Cu2+-containing amine oxidase